MGKRYVLGALFVLVLLLLMFVIRKSDDAFAFGSTESSALTPLKSEQRARVATRRSTPEADRDAVQTIRAQFELIFSENPETASLSEALSACRRLESSASILALLQDPRFGWDRMSETSEFVLREGRLSDFFGLRLHQALFERWGELDLEGGLRAVEENCVFEEKEGFDSGRVMTFNLYKGAAKVGDGQSVFEVLIPPGSKAGYGESDSCALGYVIEGWAASDPEAAWQTLVTFPAMANAGVAAIQAYFRGLPKDIEWEALANKVDDYALAGDFVAGRRAGGEFRREMAVAWVQEEPSAALHWFAYNSDEVVPNRDPSGHGARVDAYATVINRWREVDLAAATDWLETWQSDLVSVPDVLAVSQAWSLNPDPLAVLD